MNDKKVNAILKLFNMEMETRSKSDALRWEAYSLTGHRTKEISACDDSPVKDRRLYSAEAIKSVDTLSKGLM